MAAFRAARLMPDDVVVDFLLLEQPDGSMLVAARRGLSPAAARELEAWSVVVPGDVEDTRAGDPESWRTALEAGPLIAAAATGVVTNAAWSVFPAATRWLRRGRDAPAVDDAAAATVRARESVASALAVDADDLALMSAGQVDGHWRVEMKTSDGTPVTAVVLGDGTVVHVTVGAVPPGGAPRLAGDG